MSEWSLRELIGAVMIRETEFRIYNKSQHYFRSKALAVAGIPRSEDLERAGKLHAECYDWVAPPTIVCIGLAQRSGYIIVQLQYQGDESVIKHYLQDRIAHLTKRNTLTR